jgi:fructose-1-phosphate kinase PfkB-like protein
MPWPSHRWVVIEGVPLPNGWSPEVPLSNRLSSINAVRDLASPARCVVVSGSLDLSNVARTVQTIVEAVAPTPFIIDTSGAALRAAVHSGAALVKPSARELDDLAEQRLATEGDITTAAAVRDLLPLVVLDASDELSPAQIHTDREGNR